MNFHYMAKFSFSEKFASANSPLTFPDPVEFAILLVIALNFSYRSCDPELHF